MEKKKFPVLTAAHRPARVNFANLNMNRDWENVIFTGKTNIDYCSILGATTVYLMGRICFVNSQYSSAEYISGLQSILNPLLLKELEKMVLAQVSNKNNKFLLLTTSFFYFLFRKQLKFISQRSVMNGFHPELMYSIFPNTPAT